MSSLAFTDLDGREWRLRITFGTVEEIKERHEIDLFSLFEDKGDVLMRLFSDPRGYVRVLWCCISQDQKDAHKADEKSFAAAFDGDVIDRSAGPFMEAVTGLFRDPTKRSAMKSLLTKMLQMEAEAVERGAAEFSKMTIDKLLQENEATSGSGLAS